MEGKIDKSDEAPQKPKLLITVLAKDCDATGKPQLTVPELTLLHGVKHAEKFDICTIIVDTHGEIYDLKTTTNAHLIIPDDESRHALDSLRGKSSSLSDEKFDKVLMIGNMGVLSEKTTENLRQFYEENIHEGGLIRIQICNFSTRQVIEAGGNEGQLFIQAIKPDFCTLSAPESYSVISNKDTRAIDIKTNIDSFNKFKVPIKETLKTSKTPDDIAMLVKNIMDKMDHKTKASNILLIFDNGTSSAIRTVLELRHRLEEFDDITNNNPEQLLSLAHDALTNYPDSDDFLPVKKAVITKLVRAFLNCIDTLDYAGTLSLEERLNTIISNYPNLIDEHVKREVDYTLEEITSHKFDSKIMQEAIITTDALIALLEPLSPDMRLKVVQSYNNYCNTEDADSFITILKLLPEEDRSYALGTFKKDGKILLHEIVTQSDKLEGILDLLSEEDILEAVTQLMNGDGNTLLHAATDTPESFKILLEFLQKDEQLDALKVKNDDSVSVFDCAKNKKTMDVILEIFPNANADGLSLEEILDETNELHSKIELVTQYIQSLRADGVDPWRLKFLPSGLFTKADELYINLLQGTVTYEQFIESRSEFLDLLHSEGKTQPYVFAIEKALDTLTYNQFKDSRDQFLELLGHEGKESSYIEKIINSPDSLKPEPVASSTAPVSNKIKEELFYFKKINDLPKLTAPTPQDIREQICSIRKYIEQNDFPATEVTMKSCTLENGDVKMLPESIAELYELDEDSQLEDMEQIAENGLNTVISQQAKVFFKMIEAKTSFAQIISQENLFGFNSTRFS